MPASLAALTARADRGDHGAAWRLAGLLVERGDVAALTIHADRGDEHAARLLAELLAVRGERREPQERREPKAPQWRRRRWTW